MSTQRFISDKIEWMCFNNAYSGNNAKNVSTKMTSVLTDANTANGYIAGTFLNVSQIDIPLESSDISAYEEHRGVMEEFSSKIHSEVSDLVDEPFGEAVAAVVTAMSEVTKSQVLYDGSGLAARMQKIIGTEEDRAAYAGVISHLEGAEINPYSYALDIEIDEETGEIKRGRLGLRGLDEYSWDDLTRIIKNCTEVATGHYEKDMYVFLNGWKLAVSKYGGKFKVKLAPVGSRHADNLTKDAQEFINFFFGGGEAETFLKRGQKSNKISKLGDYTQLNKYVDDLKDVNWNVKSLVKKNMKNDFFDDFVPFLGDVKKVKSNKALAFAGIAGDLVTIGCDVHDNLWDPDTGEFNGTAANWQRAGTDVVVDFALDGGTAAICAAVGSAFAPPIGTLVGFGVGLGIDALMNNVKIDANGDGEKQSATEALKDGADWLFDSAASLFGADFR